MRCNNALDDARSRYLADLLLLSETNPVDAGPLDAVRAEYVACLLDCYRALDEQVLELARAGRHLFGPVVRLPAVARR